jgi:hypothetical protein
MITMRKFTTLLAGALVSACPGRTSRKSAGKPMKPPSRPRSKLPARTYVSADAQSSSAKQLSDVESLIAQGVNALIILAQDTQAIIPAVQAAADEGIPVIAYDRLIEDSRAFYLTFDNVEVGRMQAVPFWPLQPKGNYVMIKGSPTDPNADFLRGGQQEVLQSRSTPVTSRSLAKPTPMAGCRPTPSATWSRS